MNYEMAKKKHKQNFYKGRWKDTERECAFPFGKRYEDDLFVLHMIPVKYIKAREAREGLVSKYKEMFEQGTTFDPVWLTIGRKLKNKEIVMKWDSQFHCADGNHRVLAAKEAGIKEILAILPESHYEFYLKNRDKLCES